MAMISNCWYNSRRLDYINEMKKHMSVDVFGKCGDKECVEPTSIDCKRTLSKEYKFYLAFENSLCNDYITEKIFTTLSMDIVPVVLGDVLQKYEDFVIKNQFYFIFFE